MDSLISTKHSLEQVLEKTATCLGKRESQQGGGSHGGEGEGEDTGSDMDDDLEEDDDDAYYGEDIDVAAMDVGPSQAR